MPRAPAASRRWLSAGPAAEFEAQRVRESASLVRLPALARPRLTR
jgi:hypothetical protein